MLAVSVRDGGAEEGMSFGPVVACVPGYAEAIWRLGAFGYCWGRGAASCCTVRVRARIHVVLFEFGEMCHVAAVARLSISSEHSQHVAFGRRLGVVFIEEIGGGLDVGAGWSRAGRVEAADEEASGAVVARGGGCSACTCLCATITERKWWQSTGLLCAIARRFFGSERCLDFDGGKRPAFFEGSNAIAGVAACATLCATFLVTVHVAQNSKTASTIIRLRGRTRSSSGCT